MRHNAELADKAAKTARKELQVKRKRIDELNRLIQLAYEDRARGKMPRIVVGALPKDKGEEHIIDIVYKVDFSSVIRYKFEK